MMVIMGTSTLPDAGNSPAPRVNIHPADRCTWMQDAQTGSGTTASSDYTISRAFFYPGAGGGDSENPITDPILGFIGKSGRFVPITS